MQSVDPTAVGTQPRLETVLLFAEVRAFVDAWQLVLASAGPWTPEQVKLLRERCKALQARARTAGVGGLVHHLGSCERCLGSPIPDRDEISRCLGNVTQVAWQLEQEAERDATQAAAAASGASSSTRESPAPPPRVTEPVAAPLPVPDSIAPPPPLHALPLADTVAPEAPAAREVRAAFPVAAPSVAVQPVAVQSVAVEPIAVPVAPPRVTPRPPLTLSPPRRVSEPPPLKLSTPVGAVPSLNIPPPPALDASLLANAADVEAKSLRARLRSAAVSIEVAPPELLSLPAAASLELMYSPRPDPRRLESEDAAVVLAEVLGMSAAEGALPGSVRTPTPPRAELSPPRRLGPDSSGLPLLAPPTPPGSHLLHRDLDARLDRIRRAGSYPVQAPPAFRAGSSERARTDEPLADALRARPSGVRWWAGPLGVGVVGGIVGLVLLLRPRPVAPGSEPVQPLSQAPLSSVRPALLPSPRLTNENERIAALLSQVHGRGGVESPELADLLDEEAGLLGKALTQRCTPGSAGCELLAEARQLLDSPNAGPPAHGPAAPLGAWLEGLHLPEIGFRDDPRVRELVELHTENASGRERFQGLLFQCGAYEELFRRSLVAHGLPTDLTALVMVESGCVSDAESPVGARGLWQFMPATARAYHLRVNSGVIDERLSPTKSTDAGLNYLADLYRKLGSWELALASYNMGPFGLLARLRQAGDKADFWDLANSGRLPSETAAYVPRIQAYALILANLSHFHFEAAQHRSAESSATLSVPAGTRLGLVAHAVSSSTSRIRELNPDIVADVVPGLIGERFSLRVPSDSGPHAAETLSHLIADADRSDECVPHGFDWGRQRFTKAMASRCGQAAAPSPTLATRAAAARGASLSPAGRSARGPSR